jgi:hypothetical protein
MIPAEELTRLSELEAKATPGPWKWESEGRRIPQGSYLGETLITLGDTYENSNVDCELVAVLRNNAKALLETARAARWVRTSERLPTEEDGRGDLPSVLGWSSNNYEVVGVPFKRWREDPEDWPDWWLALPPSPEETEG